MVETKVDRVITEKKNGMIQMKSVGGIKEKLKQRFNVMEQTEGTVEVEVKQAKVRTENLIAVEERDGKKYIHGELPQINRNIVVDGVIREELTPDELRISWDLQKSLHKKIGNVKSKVLKYDVRSGMAVTLVIEDTYNKREIDGTYFQIKSPLSVNQIYNKRKGLHPTALTINKGIPHVRIFMEGDLDNVQVTDIHYNIPILMTNNWENTYNTGEIMLGKGLCTPSYELRGAMEFSDMIDEVVNYFFEHKINSDLSVAYINIPALLNYYQTIIKILNNRGTLTKVEKDLKEYLLSGEQYLKNRLNMVSDELKIKSYDSYNVVEGYTKEDLIEALEQNIYSRMSVQTVLMVSTLANVPLDAYYYKVDEALINVRKVLGK